MDFGNSLLFRPGDSWLIGFNAPFICAQVEDDTAVAVQVACCLTRPKDRRAPRPWLACLQLNGRRQVGRATGPVLRTVTKHNMAVIHAP